MAQVTSALKFDAEGKKFGPGETENSVWFHLKGADAYYTKKCAENRAEEAVKRCWPTGNIIFLKRKSLNPLDKGWKPSKIEVTIKYLK